MRQGIATHGLKMLRVSNTSTAEHPSMNELSNVFDTIYCYDPCFYKIKCCRQLRNVVKKDNLSLNFILIGVKLSCCLGSPQTMANMFIYIYLKSKSVTWR